MTRACLVVEVSGLGWLLRVLNTIDELYATSEPPSEFRQSAIFPVSIEGAAIEKLKAAKYWAFFTLDSPFLHVGEASPAIQAQLWFSHGLASIILPSENRKEIDDLASKWSRHLRAVEIWTIGEKNHISADVRLEPPAELKRHHRRLADFSTLGDPDVSAVLQELQLNLFDLSARAAQHLPPYLDSISRIVSAINEIIPELLWLENTSGPVPSSLSDEMAERLRTGGHDPVSRRVNLRVDTLIQLNSSITYVISQAFYGASPILAHRTLVGGFSLLGIGTAWRAIARFTEYIEQVFERIPVITAIKQSYAKRAGVNVRLNQDTAGPAEWIAAKFALDEDLEGVAPSSGKPKLVCFSGRLGFGEAEFTATAATQLLHAGDSARWSIMTLSHELLHAHVHAILAVLLRLPDRALSEEAEQRHRTAYRLVEEHRGAVLVGEHLAQSLIFATYEYAKMASVSAGWRRDLSRHPAKRATAPVRPMADKEFIENYLDKRGLMEEVMVHVLDLHYFYHEDVPLYLDLLWESWATVPAVIEDLENYILRSLAAVGATQAGSAKDRFEAATRELELAITRLQKNGSGGELMARVLAYISDSDLRKGLFVRYPVNLYIGDATRRFLFSHRVQKALSGDDQRNDPNIQRKNGRINYLIDTAEFSGAVVVNPVAFLLDRLRRCSLKEDSLPEEYRSAWIFLASASPPLT